MPFTGAQTIITAAVTTWEGLTVAPHRFGGVEYCLGTREIGHLHGDHPLDIPFPTKMRNELVETGAAEQHHLLADSGWISFYLRSAADVDHAVTLLRRSYDIAQEQASRRTPTRKASSHTP